TAARPPVLWRLACDSLDGRFAGGADGSRVAALCPHAYKSKGSIMKKLASGPSLASGFPLALLLLGVSGGQALAHKSPSNCTTNRFVLAIEQNPAGNIVSGQTMNYTVSVFNPGPGIGIGCDVTSATVTFTCPGADGTSS